MSSPTFKAGPGKNGRLALVSGLGYIGRALGAEMAKAGYSVLGYDPQSFEYKRVVHPVQPPPGVLPGGDVMYGYQLSKSAVGKAAEAVDIELTNDPIHVLLNLAPDVLLSASGSSLTSPNDPNAWLYGENYTPELTNAVIPDQTIVAAVDSAGTLRDLLLKSGAVSIAHTTFGGKKIPVQRGVPFDRQHLVVRPRPGCEVLILGGESVINFWGEDPIPPSYIQFTRGLMHVAARKATTLYGRSPGYYAPTENEQESAIIDRFIEEINHELSDQGFGDLTQPTF